MEKHKTLKTLKISDMNMIDDMIGKKVKVKKYLSKLLGELELYLAKHSYTLEVSEEKEKQKQFGKNVISYIKILLENEFKEFITKMNKKASDMENPIFILRKNEDDETRLVK